MRQYAKLTIMYTKLDSTFTGSSLGSTAFLSTLKQP